MTSSRAPLQTEHPDHASAGDPRAAALAILDGVLDQRRALEPMLAEIFGQAPMAARDRAFARLMAATTLRRLGEIDALIGRCLERKLPPRGRSAMNLLRLGAAQLCFIGVPAHAAVDATVALAEGTALKPYRRLVNAVLRRLSRQGQEWLIELDGPRLDTPAWLWESWEASYGAPVARAIATAHLKEPPLDLTCKGDPTRWAEALDADILPSGTLRRRAEAGHGPIEELAGYAEGDWWVQDLAAAMPARLLGDVSGAIVLDLCAAPGGKTAQLAAAGARVIALDRSAPRLARLAANLARLGLSAELVEADAATYRPGARSSHILLDAPCSATGTIRRHPDIARLKAPEDLVKLAHAQARLLEAAAGMLAPGGCLVFTTCSLQPEEGIHQIEALLARRGELARRPIEPAEIGDFAELISAEGDLASRPDMLGSIGGIDGFYAARLVSRP